MMAIARCDKNKDCYYCYLRSQPLSHLPVVCYSTIRGGPVSWTNLRLRRSPSSNGGIFMASSSSVDSVIGVVRANFLNVAACCCREASLGEAGAEELARRAQSQPRTLQRAFEHTNDVHVWKSQSSDVLANATREQWLLHCEDCISSFCHVLVDDLENVTYTPVHLHNACRFLAAVLNCPPLQQTAKRPCKWPSASPVVSTRVLPSEAPTAKPSCMAEIRHIRRASACTNLK